MPRLRPLGPVRDLTLQIVAATTSSAQPSTYAFSASM